MALTTSNADTDDNSSSTGGNDENQKDAAAAATTEKKADASEILPVVCQGCNEIFPSRNAVFKHLKVTKAKCLSGEEYQHYLEDVQSKERIKTVLLIGYLTSETLPHGDDVTNLVLDIIMDDDKDKKFHNRSYGNDKRGIEVTRQDDGSSALTELLCVKIAPLPLGQTVDDWIDATNAKLDAAAQGVSHVRIHGRHDFPIHKFNAEMDVSHRRVEYILPVDMLYNESSEISRKEFEHVFQVFSASPFAPKTTYSKLSDAGLDYLHAFKKQMQLLCCQIVDLDPNDKAAVMEKDFHLKKRKRQQRKPQNETIKSRVLRRRRFHNFTPRVMAHEYLAFRRLDRFYHRGTLKGGDKMFFNLSLTGDLFLQGQVVRIVGLLVAIVRGLIDPDIIECVFDEAYPHLVPAPPAPAFAQIAGEAAYMNWEGKAKCVLSPRRTKQYENTGFNTEQVIARVGRWENVLHEDILKKWAKDGLEQDGRLTTEKRWMEGVLEPWAQQARAQLNDYREWKAATIQEGSTATALVDVPVESIDPSVPEAYKTVLHYLREADKSELWPSTTPKRQLVMVTTKTDDQDGAVSLSMAHVKAKLNKSDRSSAYAYEEGEGGASGSFSVGAFPGGMQPKGNELFPELMKAAFELERVLLPDREPSSTIAINRNAQFRPHTDSGAGAGQSTSLIVGMGNYSGGELVVEGEQKDIRYKPLEFNGWTQRHWTMPFQGERYSLVWFTPKGCEGIQGIDL